MQVYDYIKPIYIDFDTDDSLLKDGAVRFLKNYTISSGNDLNDNSDNKGVGSSLPSNKLMNMDMLPGGNNMCIGTFVSYETNEVYFCNYNSKKNHGIYVINKNQLIEPVFVGPELNFSNNPKYAFGLGKIAIKVVYNSDGENRKIKEIHLLLTDGENWQFWINVLASKKTKSFTAPNDYFKTNDRKQFVQYASRPPMFAPYISEVPYTDDDKYKPNFILKKSIQFAYRYIYNDGRTTAYSPISETYFQNNSPCGVDNSGTPRCLNLLLNAGGPLVERIEIIFRFCDGDWYRYDTLNAFDQCDIKEEYWLRTNKWGKYNFDSNSNTIKYIYCGDKDYSIIDQDEVNVVYNSLPIKSQSLISDGDAIIMGNNLPDYPNLYCSDSIKIEVENPSKDAQCDIKMRTIRIAAVIHNIDFGWNQAIYKTDKSSMGIPPDTFVFGGLAQYDPIIASNVKFAETVYSEYKQHFPIGTNIEGFLMYSPGTSIVGRTKQYRTTGGSLIEPWGSATCNGCGVCNGCIRSTITQHLRDNRGFYIQILELKVPSGKYPIRIASHFATEDSDYEKTSTYTVCTTDYNSYSAKKNLNIDNSNFEKEIVIDVCDGDWDFEKENKIFVIADNTAPDDSPLKTGHTVIEGYFTDNNSFPLELAKTNADSNRVFYNNYTDHNGFTFLVYDRKILLGGNKHTLSINYLNDKCSQDSWESDKKISAKRHVIGTTKLPAASFIIKGKAKICDSGSNLGGVHVMLTHGSSSVTKNDGTFEIVAHHDMKNLVRNDKVLVIQANINCFSYSCSCICTEDKSISVSGCTSNQIIDIGTWDLKVSFANYNGLKGGGKYGIGIAGADVAGRRTFVKLLDYIDIPSFITNGGIYKPSKLKFTINGPLSLPEGIEYLYFYRTSLLNIEYYLQWHGDSLEMIDSLGNVSGVSNAISYRLNIESLLKFNETNFEGTTTKYQWVQNDFIRFYTDGDGVLFKEYIDLTISTSKDGKYLIIPYDSRIKSLVGKCGFYIEIIRPKLSNDKELFQEIPLTIPVVNGMPQITSGYLNTFDTFYLNRKITNTLTCNSSLSHPFESQSISDYWGANCPMLGRVNTRDEKAEQRWHPDQLIKSNEFVNEGRVNGLGTFKSSSKKSFKGQDWGGIVSMIPQQKIILVICENDYFTIDYQMNYAKIDSNGFIVANNPLEAAIGEPYQKNGSNFGCSYEDIRTIVYHDSNVYWIDRNRKSFVLCNMQSAIDLSIDSSSKSYFRNKLSFISEYNASLGSELLSKGFDIICGINIKTKEILVSFSKRRSDSFGLTPYVNLERSYRLDHQETICFNVESKKITQFASFVPEAYCNMEFSNMGIDLIMFAKGYAYTSIGDKGSFNKFFGFNTEQIIEPVFNMDPGKVKVYQSIGIDSINPYFVDRVITNNQMSYIPLSFFKKEEDIYYARILTDVNTYPNPFKELGNMLIDGKIMRGQFCKVRLVIAQEFIEKYNEISSIHINTIASERSKNDNTNR